MNDASNRKVVVKLEDSHANEVCNCAVGFLKFENNGQNAVPAGTGTFVKLGKVYGIVTAAHAINNLPSSEVGLVRFPAIEPQIQNFRLKMERTEKCILWDGVEGHSPDIGFLRIPEVDAVALEAQGAVFYNLELDRDYKVTSADHQMSKANAVVGVVGEWTEDAPGGRPNTKKVIVGGLFGAANIVREFKENGTGLIETQIDYGAGPRVPKSYEGVSGGAFWELHAELKGTEIVSVRKKLTGVAFKQSEDHKSIFVNDSAELGKLVAAVVKKWPDETKSGVR